ncbi:hypothetical protein [Acinetobacter sp. WCHAc010034]|uniref:hypothetical protein n=1 Tax=Acinetobacter sp. WCHAc010034 TaxID=1879049 RepID=UPI0013C31EAE|nr:hypothetical protein [Acinetobacter sp. WCHAc010034]
MEKLLKNQQKMAVYSVFLLKGIILRRPEARWRCCSPECAGAGAAFYFSAALLHGSASGLLRLRVFGRWKIAVSICKTLTFAVALIKNSLYPEAIFQIKSYTLNTGFKRRTQYLKFTDNTALRPSASVA